VISDIIWTLMLIIRVFISSRPPNVEKGNNASCHSDRCAQTLVVFPKHRLINERQETS